MGETDLISRQAAIAYSISGMIREIDGDKWIRVSEVRESIKMMPSAQQWIPCSERLPEVGQSVLFSVGGMYSAEGCLRDDGDWCQFRWSAVQSNAIVIAWMPLPLPYKGEQE